MVRSASLLDGEDFLGVTLGEMQEDDIQDLAPLLDPSNFIAKVTASGNESDGLPPALAAIDEA